MPKRGAKKAWPAQGRIRDLAAAHCHVEREATWLVFLSVVDLMVTYALLWQRGRYYESNPLANWFFVRWNVAGLAAFKFGLIGAVIVLGEVIERHRPGWGRAVLVLGCLGAAAVAVHGVRLFLAHGTA